MHAPRGSVYDLLDDVFLLAPNGLPIFIGPASSACAYFERLGHLCPPNSNIAEFLIDLVSVDTEDHEQASADQARIQELAVAFRKEEARRQAKEKRESGEEGAEGEKSEAGSGPKRRRSKCSSSILTLRFAFAFVFSVRDQTPDKPAETLLFETRRRTH